MDLFINVNIATAILETLNIDQSMQEQDEIDKGGISLMGVKHEERTKEYTNLNDSQSLERI